MLKFFFKDFSMNEGTTFKLGLCLITKTFDFLANTMSLLLIESFLLFSVIICKDTPHYYLGF